MAKRKRSGNELTELPMSDEGVSSATASEEQPVVGQEGLNPVGNPVHVDGTHTSEEVAPADMSSEEERDYGPFWALLTRAGYALW